MKKALSLILALVMCLSLCACGSASKGSTSAEIELTLDNYQKYLQVDVSCSASGEGVRFMNPIPGYTGPWYPEILSIVSTKGVSTNFNYNDVVVVIEISGTYDDYHAYENALNSKDNPFEMTITVETDIAGNGKNTDIFKLAYKLVTRNALINSTWKVVSISGTVTPA
ncbi:MAG: hypothetical protein IKB80_04535 [Oscillospiraceae bacterium]|nr:hypothetical protein [Oscillospiraceae bacterium]